jgi:hypothetical protein
MFDLKIHSLGIGLSGISLPVSRESGWKRVAALAGNAKNRSERRLALPNKKRGSY